MAMVVRPSWKVAFDHRTLDEALSTTCRQNSEMDQYLEEKRAAQKRLAPPFQRSRLVWVLPLAQDEVSRLDAAYQSAKAVARKGLTTACVSFTVWPEDLDVNIDCRLYPVDSRKVVVYFSGYVWDSRSKTALFSPDWDLETLPPTVRTPNASNLLQLEGASGGEEASPTLGGHLCKHGDRISAEEHHLLGLAEEGFIAKLDLLRQEVDRNLVAAMFLSETSIPMLEEDIVRSDSEQEQ
ncbi:hypothetical protein Taro_002471 [Colocasia esculenta]|uniref:Uncharacterized protein n=1 Tax=Colocasia esculenta TaxID=4460 RepID=A0A843TNV4_COLES|nr:hypothetical protein [Colocasia esculenta]